MHFNKQNYANYLSRLIPTKYIDYISELEFENSVNFEYNIIKNRLTDVDFAKSFRNNITIEGSSYHDYLYKEFWVNEIQIVTSIRFKGGNRNIPFVQIDYMNSDFEKLAENFSEIKTEIYKKYFIFKPIFIRMTLRNEDEFLFSKLNPKIDLAYYSCPLIDVSSIKVNNENLKLEKIEKFSEKDYEYYINEYNQFNLENPELDSVSAESFQSINSIQESDIFVKAYIDNQWAGLAMYCIDRESIFYGYLVREKIIFKKFRGLNLSADIQTRAFQDYLTYKNGFIFGTIMPENIGSIRSALKTGRENLVSTYFFKF